jgi:hypothetical protein
MAAFKKRQEVYAVYTRDKYGCSIYKNIKSLCEIPDYEFSKHTLYKHNFSCEFYTKGVFTVFKQFVY